MSDYGWKSALRALLLVLLGGLAIAGFARAIAQPFWLPLYLNKYEFLPGDWFARHLNASRVAPEETCILVGASTVREGLDNEILQDLLPGQRVENLGTTGSISAIGVVEIQSHILASLGDRYACIVVGMHPFFLHEFAPDSYDVLVNDYAAVLPLSSLFTLTDPPWNVNPKADLLFKFFMPFAQNAIIARRIARSILFQLHHSLIDASTPLSQFEEHPNELVPMSRFAYSGPSILKSSEARFLQLNKDGRENPDAYGKPRPTAALHGALRLLSGLTDRLIVVEMPQSFFFDETDRVSRASYESALLSAGVPVTSVRCKIPRSDHYLLFHDAAHLNADGRDLLSRSLAPYLSMSNGVGELPPKSGICALAGPTS